MAVDNHGNTMHYKMVWDGGLIFDTFCVTKLVL